MTAIIPSKICKVIAHQRTQPKPYAEEDIALSLKDFPHLKSDDVVEIINADEDSASLLLKLGKNSLRDDLNVKDTISLEQSIAVSFQLIKVKKVNPAEYEVDTLELVFREQYLGRSEMWRLKNFLLGGCVYINQKIDYYSGALRLQVSELWAKGERASYGVVAASTKIVFRSSTSMVYLFVQMSSEMWEFDLNGDLYFEKIVNGFLTELFNKWKRLGCNHEVTIVLFSRLYYSAPSLDHFPDCMKECLQTDFRGRFYEDFYRVAVQNERYEEWGGTLILLRSIFVQYREYLLRFHSNRNPSARFPKAFISSAAQGNFLEVLNMSLNVFEKHYVDRSFDRTGQLSIVCTPGDGVFEVDREFTNLTMQRIIDNGVGSDLVCAGEQPLHAVPLLKVHSKLSPPNSSGDYSMPHWINLSFYSKPMKASYSGFIPRLRLPFRLMDSDSINAKPTCIWRQDSSRELKLFPSVETCDISSLCNSLYDFDEYDKKVFKSQMENSATEATMKISKSSNFSDSNLNRGFRRQNSEPEINLGRNWTNSSSPYYSPQNSSHDLSTTSDHMSSSAISIPDSKRVESSHAVYSSSFGGMNIEGRSKSSLMSARMNFTDHSMAQGSPKLYNVGDVATGGSPVGVDSGSRNFRKNAKVRSSRALINPFDPAQNLVKWTSSRRRWTHIFPRGPSGTYIQHHHKPSKRLEIVPESIDGSNNHIPGSKSSAQITPKSPVKSGKANIGISKTGLIWGPTGDQEWTPSLTTGVDWKSIIIPACLPITTDYIPDDKSFTSDYFISPDDLRPEDINADYAQQRAVHRSPLTTKEIFMELISQRLAQGFQLILKQNVGDKQTKFSSLKRNRQSSETDYPDEEYMLSIGRIYHQISLKGSSIHVTRYRPKRPYRPIRIHYRYRFFVPHNDNYEVSWTDFSTEELENFNWNFVDHYICTRGDKDFALNKTMKFWRLRLLILPTSVACLKRLLDGHQYFDIFSRIAEDDKLTCVESFLKFIETCINRIRRPNNSFPKGGQGSQSSATPGSGFRERVNSNRIGEKPKIKSSSKTPSSSVPSRQISSSGRTSPIETELKVGQSPESGDSNPTGDSVVNSGAWTTPELKKDVSLKEIIEAMRSQTIGVSFIKSSDLPPWTFVSYDAVVWIMKTMEGITSVDEAVAKFDCMVERKLISHASGDGKHKFEYGFYLYFITSGGPGLDDLDGMYPSRDRTSFRKEWMEVGLGYSKLSNLNPYKEVYLDVDTGRKSDRKEWGHGLYQCIYKPDETYEINVQWIQATGCIVTDLVQGWSRKAQQCNLQLIPVPTDPFALPDSSKSDPLRGPIFVPLNIDKILDKSNQEWMDNISAFQQAIVVKFGFVKTQMYESQNSKYKPGNKKPIYEYFHYSGNMFVIVHTPEFSNQLVAKTKDSPAKHHRMQDSPTTSFDGDYITMHVSGKNKDSSYLEEDRVGFYWSWNYMISKRWKTTSTPALGDEIFMFRMLRDFQGFCRNEKDRLFDYWLSFNDQDYS